MLPMNSRFLVAFVATAIFAGCSGVVQVPNSGGPMLRTGATAWLPLSATREISPVGAKEVVLHNFQVLDGQWPSAGLLVDANGSLYSTTVWGGTANEGTVFKLTPSGSGYTESVLYNFKGPPDGEGPVAPLIVDKSGAFYGTTYQGGANNFGAVFKLTPTVSGYAESILYSLKGSADGAYLWAGLVADKEGALYGTAAQGGVNLGGVVYRLTPKGSGYAHSVLYRFQGGNDGASPTAGLIVNKSGALYGTTPFGGDPACSGCGTVFKLTPSRPGYTEYVLYRFQGNQDGEFPRAGLLEESGALYGTTTEGGGAGCGGGGCGVVFKLAPSRKGYIESVLHRFRGGTDGAFPLGGLVADSNGALYGTTEMGGGTNCVGSSKGCGTVFKLIPSGSRYVEKVIYRFQGPSDGQYPYVYGSLISDAGGALYGTTFQGGTGYCSGYGCGTVFKVTP